MINLMLDGFEGNLTSSKWAKITKASQDTAGRDIEGLLRANVLVKEPWRGRSTSYFLVTSQSEVLMLLARYVAIYSDQFATSGAAGLSSDQRDERIRRIEELSNQIEVLAHTDTMADARYRKFERINDELHELGFFPDGQLISALGFMTQAEAGLTIVRA